MKTGLKVSVVITNYNHGQYLENAVKSIINQSYDNLEIIVIDDGSTDGSKSILASLKTMDPRIRTIQLNANSGKWFALNFAIKEATGDLIALQDADDECSVYRIERQMHVLLEQKSVHNLCGFKHCYNDVDMKLAKVGDITRVSNYEHENEYSIMDHKEVLQKVYTGFKTPGINHYFVGHDYEVHGASTLFYKQLWEHGLKFMPGNMGLRCQVAEDSDHNTKTTLLLQKTSVLKEPLYFYRRNSGTNGAWKEAK